MPKAPAIVRSTGREREDWFQLLDAWGAVGRPYREIADWLMGEHDLSKWWAQKIIVEYEQARGIRPPGIRRDGTFEVGTSKTINAPVKQVFEAFVETSQRDLWLDDGSMSLRGSRPSRSARFDWEAGPSRVSVELASKGVERSTVSITHSGLDSSTTAEQTKSAWKERLANLKAFVES